MEKILIVKNWNCIWYRDLKANEHAHYYFVHSLLYVHLFPALVIKIKMSYPKNELKIIQPTIVVNSIDF